MVVETRLPEHEALKCAKLQKELLDKMKNLVKKNRGNKDSQRWFEMKSLEEVVEALRIEDDCRLWATFAYSDTQVLKVFHEVKTHVIIVGANAWLSGKFRFKNTIVIAIADLEDHKFVCHDSFWSTIEPGRSPQAICKTLEDALIYARVAYPDKKIHVVGGERTLNKIIPLCNVHILCTDHGHKAYQPDDILTTLRLRFGKTTYQFSRRY